MPLTHPRGGWFPGPARSFVKRAAGTASFSEERIYLPAHHSRYLAREPAGYSRSVTAEAKTARQAIANMIQHIARNVCSPLGRINYKWISAPRSCDGTTRP
jgi:hypothetical protein